MGGGEKGPAVPKSVGFWPKPRSACKIGAKWADSGPVPPADELKAGVYSGRGLVNGGPEVRFPLRRQQQDDVAAAPGAPHGAPDPIPFPPGPGGPQDGQAGNWEELLRTRTLPRMDIPLRGQMNGSDARAERVVRQVRGDVERLQKLLDTLSAEQGELMDVDPAAIAANPEAAATLAPSLLVRAVVSAENENRRLRKRLAKARQREQQLHGRLQQMEVAEATRKSRLDTLEEVLAALHGNLQDLRQEREFLRQWAPAQLGRRAELPPGEDRR